MTAMDEQRRYIAQQLFKLLVYRSKGTAFQALFEAVMGKKNKEFRKVKPYGNIGDRKNDGFVASTGSYFQVYGPEQPEKQDKDAAEKMKEDFGGLVKSWNEDAPIKATKGKKVGHVPPRQRWDLCPGFSRGMKNKRSPFG